MVWLRKANPAPSSIKTLPGRRLFHRDFLVNLFDLNALAPAVGTEPEVDGRSDQVVSNMKTIELTFDQPMS